MRSYVTLQFALLGALSHTAFSIEAPTGLIARAGDRSANLYWNRNTEPNISGYRVYRSTSSEGSFSLLTPSLVRVPGFSDVSLTLANGQNYFYRVTAVSTTTEESPPSEIVSVVPAPFTADNHFLEFIQQAHFEFFWRLANPANGLVPDRSPSPSVSSIAAVGFGLSAIGIGVDHGWISRAEGAERVLTTLNTFLNGPQGDAASGVIGYNGWFYHFLDMNTALRAPGSELSSIDTVLFLAGMLEAKEYFNGENASETAIRAAADAIFNRVDWNWMARGTDAVSMGWFPGTGFINNEWIGYNEAMILYVLGMGAPTNPLPATSWQRWTSGYIWATHYSFSFVQFAPLFGHHYSHCWVDFRHIADDYMNGRDSTYFINSRKATLANRAYCMANPNGWLGYNGLVWGLTASDGPSGYNARGAPPAFNDDGTIAPTAAGGSMAFTPEVSLPSLRYFYTQFRRNIWTAFGFRDAFNLGAQWWATDNLGIDQGPIVIMIENYRTQKVWERFMRNEIVQRGLQRAGFQPLPRVGLNVALLPDEASVQVSWPAAVGRTYQVESSPDLLTWFPSPAGEVIATNSPAIWLDTGPPSTATPPFEDSARFYQVFQLGAP